MEDLRLVGTRKGQGDTAQHKERETLFVNEVHENI